MFNSCKKLNSLHVPLKNYNRKEITTINNICQNELWFKYAVCAKC